MTPREREILHFVAANPGSYERDLAVALDLTEGSLSLHLHRLSSLGCVRAVRVGHRLTWYPDVRPGNF